MVLISKRDGFKRRISSKKWLFFTASLGVTCLLISIVLFFVDPIVILAKSYLRLDNGTLLYDLMSSKVDGARIYVYMFNFTNPEEYQAGRDEKIKLNEVGPFVYQEYRLNQDLVIDPERSVMSYSPLLWTEFVPEESIGDPKQIYLTMPSIPMLAGTDLMSKYPFLLRKGFNILASSVGSKATMNTSAYDYLWGYSDPLIKFANTAIPGLFYYNSSGLLERLYDAGAYYTMEIGTKDEEKFSVKRVKKLREGKIENIQTFSNAYEGAVFPPDMTPDSTLSIYRHSVCKTLKLKYTGTKKTQYGSEAFAFDIANETFNEYKTCDSKGWCPSGVLNMAPCYFNFPFVISRGHFLDADPRLLERFEGLKPDRKLHSSELVVDPRIGVSLSAAVSIQINLALGDLGYNNEARRFKDTILPLCHYIIKLPGLPPRAQNLVVMLYIYLPYIFLSIKVISLLLGLGLLAYSAKMFHSMYFQEKEVLFESVKGKSLRDSTYIIPLMTKELQIIQI